MEISRQRLAPVQDKSGDSYAIVYVLDPSFFSKQCLTFGDYDVLYVRLKFTGQYSYITVIVTICNRWSHHSYCSSISVCMPNLNWRLCSSSKVESLWHAMQRCCKIFSTITTFILPLSHGNLRDRCFSRSFLESHTLSHRVTAHFSQPCPTWLHQQFLCRVKI